jgi:methionyl-tRNA synthetase
LLKECENGPMFYVTTPIYYVNDAPHIGHAYTTLLADVLARYARLGGRPVFFLTGVDEHGQKVQQAAQRHGVEPQAYVDEMQECFRAAWRELNIQPDDFIRTTQPRHVRVVQHVLQQLWEQGDIYRGEYQGWYCVPDERFWTEKDLRDGFCPECGRPVEQITEANYFFRMSAYQGWLVETIKTHPDFIQPAHRRNEVLGFLRQPLGDLCISRPVRRLSWGIPLPFDPDYVTYVWFDALLNYVTAAGYLEDETRFARVWPQAIHLIGKDILTTHCVYWPTMLRAAGLPMPKTIFAHGWWVIGEQKMGKSLGNAVRPLDLAQVFGVDAFRYLLMREMTPGYDADFEPERLAARYQSDLSNNLGNLLHRVTHMIARYCGGQVPAPGSPGPAEEELRQRFDTLPAQVFAAAEGFAVQQALTAVMDGLSAANQYLEQTAPWKQAKNGAGEAVATSLYTAAEAVRLSALLLSPVLPERAAETWRRLGWQPSQDHAADLNWGDLTPGSRVLTGAPLFPRLEEDPVRV